MYSDLKGARAISTLDWSQCSAVEIVPGKVSGAWIFKGSRIPVSLVFRNLEAGATIEEIMEWFHLDREPIVEVLLFAARSLDAPTLIPSPMLILFDHSTPIPLRHALKGHIVVEAIDHGWQELVNDALLDEAEAAGFEVLLTADKKFRYHQDVTSRKIALVVLGSAQWPILSQHVDRVLEAIEEASPGSFIQVQIPLC